MLYAACSCDRRPSINDILAMPVMKARIARFLSATIQVQNQHLNRCCVDYTYRMMFVGTKACRVLSRRRNHALCVGAYAALRQRLCVKHTCSGGSAAHQVRQAHQGAIQSQHGPLAPCSHSLRSVPDLRPYQHFTKMTFCALLTPTGPRVLTHRHPRKATAGPSGGAAQVTCRRGTRPTCTRLHTSCSCCISPGSQARSSARCARYTPGI